MTNLALPVHSYQLRSRPASPARLVNCHPELLPAGAATPVILSRSPGIKAWATVGTGTIKGMYAKEVEFSAGRQNYLYVVSGDEWYYVNTSGAATLIGNIGTPNRIDMSSNYDSVVVVNEPKAYYFDGTTFGEITDDDFVSRGSGDVEYLDKFYVHREPNSNRIFTPEIGSATDFNSLRHAKADDAPDELVGIFADRGLLLLFGTDTVEMWENTGGSFVFERIVNGTIEVGCLSANSISRVFNQVFFVADDYTVRRLEGLQAIRVSSHAIEQHLEAETVIESLSYSQEGHFFYCLTTDVGTYLYDVMTQEWSERETYGEPNWLPQHSQQFAGKQLVGDSKSNKIGELDFDTFTEWDNTQRMEWTYQPVWADGQRAFHDRLEIVLETGVGNTVGQGSDPVIMLQMSDDGGKTWQSMPDRSFGALGERETRAIWHNLGSARKRVYKAAVSDPVAVTVLDTLLEVRGGRL